MRIRAGAASDIGPVRSNNEDTLLVSDGLWAVADGVGGHRGGDVASAMAIRVLRERFPTSEPSKRSLVAAVQAANRGIFDAAAEDENLLGMGTTLVAVAVVDGGQLAYANVGDSRIYVLEDGALRQVTADHSLVGELVRGGRLTAAEARRHPRRNVVTRSLGFEPQVAVDSDTLAPAAGDRLLLCSDGLSDYVEDDAIEAALVRYDQPDAAAAALVELAIAGETLDNVTVVVLDVADA